MNTYKQVSVFKFVLTALLLVLMTNFSLSLIFRINGISTGVAIAIVFHMIIAASTAKAIAYWFYRSVQRTPTAEERSRFLLFYGGIFGLIVCSIIVHFSLTTLRGSPSALSLLTILSYYLPYPGFAAIFFSQKHFSKYAKASANPLSSKTD